MITLSALLRIHYREMRNRELFAIILVKGDGLGPVGSSGGGEI